MKRKLQSYETEFGTKYRLNLPYRDVEWLGWEKGDNLILDIDRINKVIIIKRCEE